LSAPALLSLDRLDKRFGAVHAVAAVSLDFEAGCVHAVAGENGAGKSTLLRMAAGIVRPDAGTVRVDGVAVAPDNPREAIRRGIGMVQQHFALVPSLTALENAMLGAEPVRSFGALDGGAARARARAAAAQMGVTLDWDAPVETMGVGDRQRLEIVRTLMRDARVVILDEPTAVLTPAEADALYATLRRLAGAGRAVIVVTHRLDEVRRYADVASVLRRGALVSTRPLKGGDEDEVLAAVTRDIMGQDPPPRLARAPHPLGDVALTLRDVRRGHALRGVTFDVRAGEIVGLAGVEGNGQRELVRVLAGLEGHDGGELLGADGQACGAESVVVVHEDRLAEGLVLRASVRDNLVLGELARFSRGLLGFVDFAALDREAGARLERAQLAPDRLPLPAASLSGGNQQRVVVARAVARADRAAVLVLAQPTRGVDLRAARAIHAEIVRVAAAGKAVLLVSADLAELRALCDRVLVIARGRIAAELPPDAPDARFGDAMLGVTDRAGHAQEPS
jgi:simple sugar transport system ATP-binding protein